MSRPQAGLQAQQAQYARPSSSSPTRQRTTLVLVTRPENGALARRHGPAPSSASNGSEPATRHQRPASQPRSPATRSPRRSPPVNTRHCSRMPAALDGSPSPPSRLLVLTSTGVDALRRSSQTPPQSSQTTRSHARDEPALPGIDALIDELAATETPGVLMTMGKGGVGKTTIAAALAIALARRGRAVHLSTTDPAAHLDRCPRRRAAGASPSAASIRRPSSPPTPQRARGRRRHLDTTPRTLQEDLRSPCTEEIAVFRAFSGLLSKARHRIVILDTAPSGHTLRLLDLTGPTTAKSCATPPHHADASPPR